MSANIFLIVFNNIELLNNVLIFDLIFFIYIDKQIYLYFRILLLDD